MIFEIEHDNINLELNNETFTLIPEKNDVIFLNAELIEVGFDIQDDILDANLGIITERDKNHEYYDGSYTVIPKTEAQKLETAEKIMRSDVNVKEIPTFKVDNAKGTTVYIGSEITWQ